MLEMIEKSLFLFFITMEMDKIMGFYLLFSKKTSILPLTAHLTSNSCSFNYNFFSFFYLFLTQTKV